MSFLEFYFAFIHRTATCKPLPCTRTAPTNQEENSCMVFAETSILKPNFPAVLSQEGYFFMEQGSPPCCKTQRLLLK